MNERQLLNAALRQDLLGFVIKTFRTVNPNSEYRHNWHIEAITWQLDRCTSGETRRLLIAQPPRSLKSICISVAYVAWRLGRDPSLRIVCVSYSNELAGELARQFRVIVDSSWYRHLFPRMRIAKDTGHELVTTLGGGRLAVSVGGSLTGRGGDIIIIDDPLKAEEACSEVARRRVIEWYKNTLVSRLNDKTCGVIMAVMQRLHEDDLAGYLIEQGGWTRLDLPAIAIERETVEIGLGEIHIRQPGDVLHENQEPRDVLAQIKAEIGSFNFSAQYQQRPVPVEGNLINWKWFRVYAFVPAHDDDGRITQSWDTAQKAGDENDYSVCTTWLKKGSDYYLLHVHRERLDYPNLKRRVTALARQFAAHSILIEDKGAGTSLIQDLKAERLGLRPIGIQVEGDKLTRMATQAAAIEAGHVIIPEEGDWLAEFKSEILAFPHGRHDDQIDSVSQFLKWVRERERNRAYNGRVIGLY